MRDAVLRLPNGSSPAGLLRLGMRSTMMLSAIKMSRLGKIGGLTPVQLPIPASSATMPSTIVKPLILMSISSEGLAVRRLLSW